MNGGAPINRQLKDYPHLLRTMSHDLYYKHKLWSEALVLEAYAGEIERLVLAYEAVERRPHS